MDLLGTKALSKLFLKHKDCRSERWTVLQELENNTRRNYVGNIGNAEIKVGKLNI